MKWLCFRKSTDIKQTIQSQALPTKILQTTDLHSETLNMSTNHQKYTMIQAWHEHTHKLSCMRMCSWMHARIRPGISVWEEKKHGEKKRRSGREGEPDFTFCACCQWQTADLQHRHARLRNNSEMRAVSKDYMKWTTCFKVVQLDYPLHFLTRVQSRDGYKEPETRKHRRCMLTRWGTEERDGREVVKVEQMQ